jgi:drug/metabolite transporter (DMT)-like permease
MPFGELCALAAAVTWALASILFARIGKARSVPAGAMNLGKLFAAGILLSLTRVGMGSVAAVVDVPPRAGVLIALSALAGLTLGDTAYFACMETLGVSRAMLLLSSAPVFTTLGGIAFLGERPSRGALTGIVLTIAGVVLVVFRPADPTAHARVPGATSRGVALGLVAALGQASGSLLSRRAMGLGLDPLAAGAARLVVGGVLLLALAAVFGKARVWIGALRHDRAWLAVGRAALVGSYVGIWLAQTGLAKSASVGVAATLLATSPVFALPLAHAMGLERATPRAVMGAFLGVAGVAVMSLR